MRTAILIPARLGATRLPNKPLAPLGGVPLVARTARQALKSRLAQRVVVATDSDAVRSALSGLGLEVMMTSTDCASGTDRVAEVAGRLDLEAVVNLQGDEPFIDAADLDAVLRVILAGEAEMATLRTPVVDLAEAGNPNVVKVVCRDDGDALYFSRAQIPHDRGQRGGTELVYRHIGVYGFTRTALQRFSQAPPHPLEQREGLEQLRALAMGLRIRVVDARSPTRGIDTPDDLRWAEQRVRQLGDAAFP